MQLSKLALGKETGENKIPTRKELDSVKVPSYPGMGQYRDWVTQLTRNVNTTANRADDDAIAWLHKVFKQNTTFDEFYECPMAFLTLDRKMAKALSEVCPKSLKDQLTNKEVVYQNKGQQIKGRQILWMIARTFDVNVDLGHMYSIEDLSLRPFTSDKDLQGFLNKWDEICACVDIVKLEPATLSQMFQKKLKESKVMTTEVTHWRRLDANDPNKTYEWLRKSVETYLRLDLSLIHT